jgi:ABC-type polar amino acid transport system ATPase subunit
MIHVERLTKRYGHRAPVLQNIDLVVDAGQTSALLGRSGMGKSTLLRCLAGLEPFDAGRIIVDGVTAEAGQSAVSLRGRVGVVFQSLELFPHLSVLDNCTLAPRVTMAMSPAEAVDGARTLLASLDVDEVRDAFPEALSGGQRQRVAIVRALMMKPRVLLYDEPTSALDPSLKAEVGRTVREIGERTGMTQIVVTHDREWAATWCRDIFVLDDRGVTKTRDL